MARQSKVANKGPVPVLLTRPEAQSQAFAAALAARFGARVRPVIAPLMAVEMLTPAVPEGAFAGVIFTSANGVAAAAGIAGLPELAWCVGARTAHAARAGGFTARSADGDAGALVAAITADPPAGRLLYLRGAETRGNVEDRLTSSGIETVSLVIYRQHPQPLTKAAVALLGGREPVIVPLFSPESARLFLLALPADAGQNLHLVAMSNAVAEVVQGAAGGVVIAGRPDAEAMLDAMAALIDAVAPP